MFSRQTWLLALLLGATILSFEIGAESGLSSSTGAILVLVIASIKARVILLDFMEVRHAPRLLTGGVLAWQVLLLASLCSLVLL